MTGEELSGGSMMKSVALKGLSVFLSVYVLAATFAALLAIQPELQPWSITGFRASLLLFTILFSYYAFGSYTEILLGFRMPNGIVWVVSLCILLVFFPLDYFMNVNSLRDLNSGGSSFHTYGIGLVVSMVLIAPIGEELLFRGVLQSSLRNTSLGVAGSILITSSLWTLDHVDSVSVGGLLSVFIFGVLLGLIRTYTNSIYPVIILHASNNLMWLIISA